MQTAIFIIFPILGYLCGSIPFGLILSKLFGHGDIRKIGSGNIGATNALRTGNKLLAALTLLGDVLKGAVPVLASFASGNILVIFATGLLAIIGHMYPVWLKFKGGKGVATTLGVLLALMPPLFLAMIALWLLSALLFRMSSLAALIAFAAAPILAYLWLGDPDLALLTGLIAALVFWKHRGNINRILSGQESKIGGKKDKAHEPATTTK